MKRTPPTPRRRGRRGGFTLAECLIASVVVAFAAASLGAAVSAAAQQARVAEAQATAARMAEAIADEVSARPFDPDRGIPDKARAAANLSNATPVQIGREWFQASSLTEVELAEMAEAGSVAYAPAPDRTGVDHSRTILGSLGPRIVDAAASNDLNGVADRVEETHGTYDRAVLVAPHDRIAGAAVATVRVAGPRGVTATATRLLVPAADANEEN